METATDSKKFCFISSDRSDFHIIDNLSREFNDFARRILTLLLIDDMLLPRYVDWYTNFRGLP